MKCSKCQTENPSDSKYCKECATPLPLSDEILASPTKTLEIPKSEMTKDSIFAGRYKIIELLGKGGMGEVYRVSDQKLDEEMALKVLRPEIAALKETIERFKNELKLARKIAHRNVCKMYDLNEEGEIPFITMEYVKGEDLKRLIRKKEKFTEKEAISIAMQVCKGLAEAHELGVIHRDLKPQNIMIDEKGTVKVMDFGIARSVEAAGITQTGVLIGTPDYISPEQADGEEADQRSDIYSLGVILYEMVTGDVPFKGDTALSVALKHKSQLPLDPRKINPELSDDFSRLKLICMEKDRERRYQSVEAVLRDLRNIEEGLPLGTKIQPRREAFASKLIRKKAFIPALAAVFVVLAIILWQLLQKEGAVLSEQGNPSIAVMSFEDFSPGRDQDYLCDGLSDSIITALNKIRELRVPARTSSFYFKGKERNISEIGEKLNVKTVLEGSLQKVGNRIRITAQLINVADESLIWSEQYNKDYDDIFDLQDEITLAVVDELKLELLAGEKSELTKRYTENQKAYELYIRGKNHYHTWTLEGWNKALGYFQQSIEEDPLFTLAYTGIADVYCILGMWSVVPPKVAYPKASAAAEKALEIDDMLAEAHTSMAIINMLWHLDWKGAEKEFKRALELNPNSAHTRWYYGEYFITAKGQLEKALAEKKRALDLDPLSEIISFGIGEILFFERRYEEAIEEMERLKAMGSDLPILSAYLQIAYSRIGKQNDYFSELLNFLVLIGAKQDDIKDLENTYFESGSEAMMRKYKDIAKKYMPFSTVAGICANLGEIDEAFEWLEKSYEKRESSLLWIKVEPQYDNLRSDPRYDALLKKLRLN